MSVELLHHSELESSEIGFDAITLKCYLCDTEFQEGDDSYLLFKKRNGDFSALSMVLSSALGRVVHESEAHSKFVCTKCNEVLIDFETSEQKYYQLKYTIINEYNLMAAVNGLETIEFETGGDIENENDHQLLKNDNELMVDNIEIDKADDWGEIVIEVGDVETMDDDMTIINRPEFINEKLPTSNANGSLSVFKEEVNDSLVINSQLNKVDDNNLNLEENETFFDHTSGDIVEIITADHPYEQMMSENYQEESVESSSVELSTHDENSLDDQLKDDMFDHSEAYSKNRSSSHKEKRRNIEEQSICKFDGSVHTCLLCELNGKVVTEPSAKQMSTHLKTIHKSRVYTCAACNMIFTKRSELNHHKDSVHGFNENPYKCVTCSTGFSDLRSYRIHKRMHYANPKNHQCDVCDKKYPSKSLLDEHMNMHTGQRPFMCQECGKDFASKYTLNAHKRTHTDRPRPYACDECEKAFYSSQNLMQHKRLHTGLKEFICDVCSKAFGSQHNLDVHKIVHTGKKPFICRTCGKAFARRAEIRDHERTHTGEKPFKCELCTLGFAQRSNLSTHIKATHYNDKSHKCNDCNKSFKRRRLLDYHIQAVHTGERPHKCPNCSASFVYPEHFKKHMRIHTGDKPYSCEVCHKSFNSRDNRNAHRYIHSDKKPYECLECGMGFMRKPLLLTHMEVMKHTGDTIVVNEPRFPPIDVENGESQSDDNSRTNETVDESAFKCEYNEVITDTSEVRYINGEDIDAEYIQLPNSGWVSVTSSEIDET